MANLTLIKDDLTIYLNGIAIHGCDMSGLPDDLWSLHWDSTIGEIEYKNPARVIVINSESEIESKIGVSLTELNNRRNTRKAVIDAEEAAKNAHLQ
jgi:hypothetical protein